MGGQAENQEWKICTMKTKTVPLNSLTIDPGNAREHPKKNLLAIRKSLERFGQRLPLVVRNGLVVAGNGRLAVMREMGLTEAVVVSADDMTETEAKAFAIADNRSGDLAENNDAKLGEILESLRRDDSDLFEALAYSNREAENLIQVAAHARGSADSGLTLSDKMTYSVIVDFDNERGQATLLEELEKRGHKCRLLIA